MDVSHATLILENVEFMGTTGYFLSAKFELCKYKKQ